MRLTKKAAILLVLLVGMSFWTFYNFTRFRTAQQKSSTNSSLNSRQTPTSIPSDITVIKGFNYGYSPKEITVKEGETVRVRLVSDDSPHTFTISELGVNQEFTWGKDTDISFIASKKGKFQFYCTVPGHKEGGMVGTLTVD